MDRARLLTPQALAFLERAIGARPDQITDVEAARSGMTNRSFRFFFDGERYFLRVPGEGTDKLINRRQEAAVYRALRGDPISDDLVLLDPDSGYKLTRYWDNVRNCDPENEEEVRACMALLRQFHAMALQVPHEIRIYEEIDFYETLRQGPSEYPDYEAVKDRCLRLRPFLERQARTTILTHFDAVPDNFLFVPGPEGQTLHLIDWEYAGMFDPHMDISMFAIYAGYDRARFDRLMDWYFEEPCSRTMRLKLYAYAALGGLLWSNWCEYKKVLGVDFGDYARSQYRYAVDYSRLVLEETNQ